MAPEGSLTAAFAQFDTRGDGVFSLEEFVAVMTRVTPKGLAVTREEAEREFSSMDTSGNGAVKYDAFVRAWGNNQDSLKVARSMPEKVALVGSGNWGSAIATKMGLNVLANPDFFDASMPAKIFKPFSRVSLML